MASTGLVSALAEHKNRIKQLSAPLLSNIKTIKSLADELRASKFMKLSKNDLQALVRNANCINDMVDRLFKIATSENQAVLQNVTETLEICAQWMKKCKDRLNKKTKLAPSERKKIWSEFLARKESKEAKASQTRRRSGRFSVVKNDSKDAEQKSILSKIGSLNRNILSRSAGEYEKSNLEDDEEEEYRFIPKVLKFESASPLNPWLFSVTVDTNLPTIKGVEFEIDANEDALDNIVGDFVSDFADELKKADLSLSAVADSMLKCLRDSLMNPATPLALSSDTAQKVLKHKVCTLIHLLHLASHELTVTGLMEVDALVSGKVKRKENPFLTKRKAPPLPPKTKPKIAEASIPLKRLPVQQSFRYGDIEPSPEYMPEVRQNDWEALQKRWWTNDADVLPHVLVVCGAAGIGKTDYAKFVARTLTHLIPNFNPRYNLQYSFSQTIGGLPNFIDTMCGKTPVDWRRDVIRKFQQDADFILKHALLPHQIENRLQEELGDIFARVFHRREGVVLIDDVPDDKLQSLVSSPVWPKDSKSGCVFIVTTRKTPVSMPPNVVVQRLQPLDPISTQRVMLSLGGYNREDLDLSDIKMKDSIQAAICTLSPISKGIPLAARALGGFAAWTANLRKQAKKARPDAHKMSDGKKIVFSMANTLKSPPKNPEEKALAILDLDSYSLPKSDEKSGYSAAVGEIAEMSLLQKRTVSRCLSYVFMRLPRLAKGVFRALFVFAGPFSTQQVANVLQTSDHRAVSEGLVILSAVGFVAEAPKVDEIFFDRTDDDEDIKKGDGIATSHTFTPSTARNAIRKSLGRNRYVLPSAVWRFCFLLNRRRRIPGTGTAVAASNQKNWLLQLANNYVIQTQRIHKNIRLAFSEAYSKESIGCIDVIPPLEGDGDMISLQYQQVWEMALTHVPDIMAAGGLALTLQSDPVPTSSGAGLSLLGLISPSEEDSYENRSSQDSEDEASGLGEMRLELLVPDNLHVLIFPSKFRRAMYSAYLRLNVTSKKKEAMLLSLGTEGGEWNPMEQKKEIKRVAFSSMDVGQRSLITLAARRAWGWMLMANAYWEDQKPDQSFRSFSSALEQFMVLRRIEFPTESSNMGFATWNLRCIVGLCRMAEKTKGINVALKYWETALKLIEALAEKKTLLSNKFQLERKATRTQLYQRNMTATAVWKALLQLKAVSIRLHTKMGAFQNSINYRDEALKICKSIPYDSLRYLSECELAVGDTYLRLGMWEEAKDAFHRVYLICVREHKYAWSTSLRARALSGRADASRKSGSFYESSRDAQELHGLLYEYDEPLLSKEILDRRKESIVLGSPK